MFPWCFVDWAQWMFYADERYKPTLTYLLTRSSSELFYSEISGHANNL